MILLGKYWRTREIRVCEALSKFPRHISSVAAPRLLLTLARWLIVGSRASLCVQKLTSATLMVKTTENGC